MLHADADFSVTVESPVEAHNVGGVTFMEHLQLSNDLVPDGWFDLQVDQLEHRRHLVLFSPRDTRNMATRRPQSLCSAHQDNKERFITVTEQVQRGLYSKNVCMQGLLIV